MGEFATLLQGAAVVEVLPLRQLAATTVERSPAPTDEEAAKADGGMEAVIDGQAQEAQHAAAPPSLPLEGPNNSGLEEESAKPQENIKVLDPQRQLSAHAEAMEGYHAKAVNLMNANVNATVYYARRLAEVRSPAEFMALSTKHACRHFELIMTHAAAFGISSLLRPAAANSRDDERG
jgi:hypothetical protein